MRILVADDNPKVVRTLAEFLTFIGHEVQIAYNGEDALTVANSFRPVMAFLDIEMPRLTGYQVAQRLRLTGSIPPIILTAVTGMPSEGEERARQAGFDHFLAKPVDLAAIEALVKLHLDPA